MKTLSTHSQSIIFGLIGIVGFSLTLPATRLAVAELDPTFVGIRRAIIAAALAGIALAMLLHEPVSWKEVLAALIVIACVLVGRRAGAATIQTINITPLHETVQTARL